MRLMQKLAAKTDDQAGGRLNAEDAEAIVGRLQRIAALQAQAGNEIEAAEAALDQSLRACHTLDENSHEGTLLSLRLVRPVT